MLSAFLISIRAILVLTILTCVLYPLAVTAIAQLAFPAQANGSLVRAGDQILGSSLLAQKFTEPRYFWSRPSAADYGTVASGASNQGFISKKLLDTVTERRAALGATQAALGADAPAAGIPADLLAASGSGLDPHISPEAARFQAARVAAARGLPAKQVTALVEKTIEPPQFGFLGQARVNVLALNRALDAVPSGNAD